MAGSGSFAQRFRARDQSPGTTLHDAAFGQHRSAVDQILQFRRYNGVSAIMCWILEPQSRKRSDYENDSRVTHERNGENDPQRKEFLDMMLG